MINYNELGNLQEFQVNTSCGECGEYPGVLHGILLVPQNKRVYLNNVMTRFNMVVH